MSKKMTIRKLNDVAESLRYSTVRDVVEAEYKKGNRSGKLRITFSNNEAGRPTRRILECIDCRKKRYYDKGPWLLSEVDARRIRGAWKDFRSGSKNVFRIALPFGVMHGGSR